MECSCLYDEELWNMNINMYDIRGRTVNQEYTCLQDDELWLRNINDYGVFTIKNRMLGM